ncbi:MAG: thermonuclease family protein [Rhizobiaceae bacterium]|nr:thermonuclease family protein [Rhizobiaceae bacterium]
MRKIADIFSTLVIFGAIAVLITWMSLDLETRFSGKVYVADGDTVIFGKEKIRLEGIDAPEFDQVCRANGADYKCGAKSRNHLKSLVKTGAFYCKAWQRDKYERLLGQCFVEETDINARMVRDGWAVSFGDYYGEEAQAKSKRTGLWAGEFERPREWRRIRRGSVEQTGNSGENAWWKIW